jgi:hypothetical protein
LCFVKFLFHLSEVAVGIDFAREKKMFLTGFTHCKVGLWKSCELGLWHELAVNGLCIEENRLKSAISVLKNSIPFILRNVASLIEQHCAFCLFRSGLLTAPKRLVFRQMPANRNTGGFAKCPYSSACSFEV